MNVYKLINSPRGIEETLAALSDKELEAVRQSCEDSIERNTARNHGDHSQRQVKGGEGGLVLQTASVEYAWEVEQFLDLVNAEIARREMEHGCGELFF